MVTVPSLTFVQNWWENSIYLKVGKKEWKDEWKEREISLWAKKSFGMKRFVFVFELFVFLEKEFQFLPSFLPFII